LLKFAAGKTGGSDVAEEGGITGVADIPIAKFKSNKLSQIDKKGIEINDDDLNAECVRLPNAVKKGIKLQIDTDQSSGAQANYIASPSHFLGGGAGSPRLQGFDLNESEQQIQIEGEMIRKTNDNKLKKYWYALLGKELYVYKTKAEDKHKSMHSLVGVFLKEEPEEQLDASTTLYPIKLIYPGNQPRIYYCTSADQRDKWIKAIKKVIGYSNLFDFYKVESTLGKGKFGLVKAAVHIKTGKKVAVKIIHKKDMTTQDVELQRREIEILKMCQHPHIIRLLDIFENHDYIYIVMETASGGDLFTYLEKRKFKLSEDRARELSHQLATAIYYLHSYGVAHRDLKPENILMSDDSEAAECKIVDFGLSKFIGPSMTSLDPFGTLSYVAPEVLM